MYVYKSKHRQSITACSLLLLLLLRISYYFIGPNDVTKQHFCEILWRKLCLRGSFKDRGTLDRNRQSLLRDRILLLHSLTHWEGQHNSCRLRSRKLQKSNSVPGCYRSYETLSKVVNVEAMGTKFFEGVESLIFCFVYNFRNHWLKSKPIWYWKRKSYLRCVACWSVI